MNRGRFEKIQPVPGLKKSLRHEIALGVSMAEDPANAGLPDLTIRVTTIHSPWYTCACIVCNHKFREGDQVRLCPECGRPYHDDAQFDLRCWNMHFEPGKICTEGGVDRFSDKKAEIPRCSYTWPGSFPEKTTGAGRSEDAVKARESPNETLVAQFMDGLEKIWSPFGELKAEKVPPDSPVVGRDCPWCRFRIRAGDWVVECPCGCGAWFHQDVFRHLTCWNEWNGVEGNEYCPITGRSYDKENDERE